MSDDNSVQFPHDRRLLVEGQVNNIFAKVAAMRKALNNAGLSEYNMYLEEVEVEVGLLRKYLPPKPPLKRE